jgi:glycerol-3-phosphate dehydrogenase
MASAIQHAGDVRQAGLCKITEQPLDVLVVGGGIVGAGVARDAALRGFRTAIIDQADFASGTSSRSSRLLHGGMRYLAQGRIGLVREASREKRVLSQIAPHLAQPLAFIFPARKGTSWALWKLAIGAKLYDLLCGMRNLGRSQVLTRRKTIQLLPAVSDRYLTGSVRYFDALTNDSRLVIDTIRSAAAAGAVALNYVPFHSAAASGNLWHCDLRDSEADSSCVVRTRAVVNATGPWSDRIPHSNTSLRLTKGVHLVIDRHRLPLPDAVVMAEGDRILFAIPWGERVILGTTDTDYDGPLSEPRCDDADAQYVLDVVNESFPEAQLNKADILSEWAGLRPLVADPNGDPSDISRRHEVRMNQPGWWDVTGGKLTTYRLMAEETVDAISKHFGRAHSKSQTARQPLLEQSQVDNVSGILPPAVCESAVQHYCRHEWARHLEDVMLRRTSWRHYYPDHLAITARVAQWMADELSWRDSRMQLELDRYRQLVGAAPMLPPAPHVALENGHANRKAKSAFIQPS